MTTLSFSQGKHKFRQLILQGQTLKGAVFLGDINGAGIAMALIKNKTCLEEHLQKRLLHGPINYGAFRNVMNREDRMVKGGRPNVQAIMQGSY